jgi:hypothetical protein
MVIEKENADGVQREKASFLGYIKEMERLSRFLYLTENMIL